MYRAYTVTSEKVYDELGIQTMSPFREIFYPPTPAGFRPLGHIAVAPFRPEPRGVDPPRGTRREIRRTGRCRAVQPWKKWLSGSRTGTARGGSRSLAAPAPGVQRC